MKKLPTLDIVFVSIQLLLFLAYLLPLAWAPFTVNGVVKYIALALSISGVIILAIAILGLKSNLTPFPTPKSNATLIQTGLYKYMRHPIYTGILFSEFGYGLYDESSWKLATTLALWVLFYVKSGYEEKQLIKSFPAYLSYRRKTRRFIPFI